MSETEKLSAVEGFKTESQYLRGEIPEELVDDNAFFGKGSIQLLKHHGTYQQDDRDLRKERKAAGLGKAFSMMIRTKIPGGTMTSAQMLAELKIGEELGNSTIRVTTRQGIQHHGILKTDLTETIRRINDVGLSTLGACGDVNRNVMCCPGPYHNDSIRDEMQQLADQLAEYFAPRTSAYRQIWLTDPDTDEKELVASDAETVEPIYGKTYLPRKFKMGIALPEDNCIDVYAQDLGMIVVHEAGKILGYNFIVGGGMGVTPTAKKTFPAVARRMAFVTPDRVIDVAEAVVKVQRDFGNRADRKIARLKYLIANWGVEKFKAKVEEYCGFALAEPHAADVHEVDDHVGWAEQGDGRWFYGLNVENGRIKDEGDFRLKAALNDICSTLKPGIRLTAHQAIIFTDIAEGDREVLTAKLREHGVPLSEDISNARRWSIACPATPTCGLAVTESERALPGMIDQLEAELAKLGLESDVFTLRMTGCPNGCARPYNCDIGLVGKTLGKYTVFLGGRRLGDRLNWIYKDLVPAEEVVATLMPVFAYLKQDREANETLGDFCHRKGREDLLAWTEQHSEQPAG